MDLIDHVLQVDRAEPVIDLGGGASVLADNLLHAGFSDLTVLDISETALREGRTRVGEAAPVNWLHEDILSWRPLKQFALWHDRAVFHFLTEATDRDAYLRTLRRALGRRGAVVIATFAVDGPETCSALPVVRYSPHDLTETLGPTFEVVEFRREEHTTPTGAIQPFTWVAARRREEGTQA